MRRKDEELWELAQEHARRFLGRFEDGFTRAECDDLVQESAVAAWQWADEVREPGRFAAAVRTIARRKRFHALREFHRRRAERVALPDRGPARGRPDYLIAGREVPHDWLLSCLRAALAGITSRDRCILLAQLEGFCCAEIAARLDLKEETVKVRMYRARRRVRLEIERAVRLATSFEVC